MILPGETEAGTAIKPEANSGDPHAATSFAHPYHWAPFVSWAIGDAWGISVSRGACLVNCRRVNVGRDPR